MLTLTFKLKALVLCDVMLLDNNYCSATVIMTYYYITRKTLLL